MPCNCNDDCCQPGMDPVARENPPPYRGPMAPLGPTEPLYTWATPWWTPNNGEQAYATAFDVVERPTLEAPINPRFPNYDGVGSREYYMILCELWQLHLRKSSTYGTEGDVFANFTEAARIADDDPYYLVMLRLQEKLIRAFNMVNSGDVADIKEFRDLASLAIIAEVLRCQVTEG